MISVIIPAHNEENVIGETLKEIFPGVISGELNVIVVCNGCTDNTVKVVSSFGSLIKIIETPFPSKSNALNLGDEVAKCFPRIYQDADVVLTLSAIRELASALEDGKYFAAAPKMKMDLRNASLLVRSYYEIWQSLPYVKEGMIGTGVYALSEAGRRRFDRFPQIIADDGYIRALFKSHERILVDSCYSLVRAPATLEGLLKIKTRSRLGGYELREKFPELLDNEEKNYRKAIWDLLWELSFWPKVFVYLYVNLKARYLSKRYSRSNSFSGWERDETSRKIV